MLCLVRKVWRGSLPVIPLSVVTGFDALTLQGGHSDSSDEELALDLEDDEEELLKQSEKMKRQM